LNQDQCICLGVEVNRIDTAVVIAVNDCGTGNLGILAGELFDHERRQRT